MSDEKPLAAASRAMRERAREARKTRRTERERQLDHDAEVFAAQLAGEPLPPPVEPPLFLSGPAAAAHSQIKRALIEEQRDRVRQKFESVLRGVWSQHGLDQLLAALELWERGLNRRSRPRAPNEL